MLDKTEEFRLRLIAEFFATTIQRNMTDDDHLEDKYIERLSSLWDEIEILGGTNLATSILQDSKLK